MEDLGLYLNTPLIGSGPMSRAAGRPVLLKMEALQPAGSFKIRGLGRLCQKHLREGKRHLISSSGGNAGYAVAFAGKRLGASVTVVVPETTPVQVRERIENEGASVLVRGAVWDETHAYAMDLSRKLDGGYVPPFDDPVIWEGHSTIIDEISKQGTKPDTIVLSVGGGGLFCGIVEGLRRNGWNDVRVIAAETEGSASFAASMAANELVTLPGITSIATSLGAKKVAARALELVSLHPVSSCVVTDEEALSACVRFADDHRVLVEPACGAALSVAYGKNPALDGSGSALVIVCGGIGVNTKKIMEWKQHYG